MEHQCWYISKVLNIKPNIYQSWASNPDDDIQVMDKEVGGHLDKYGGYQEQERGCPDEAALCLSIPNNDSLVFTSNGTQSF